MYYINTVKVNAKFFLCLIKNHAMKTYGEWSHIPLIFHLGTRWR